MNQIDLKRKHVESLSNLIGLWAIGFFIAKIGFRGMIYFGAAYVIYLFFWTISGRAIKEPLGNLLKLRNTKGQYKNAAVFRRSAFLLQLIVGGLAAVILLFAAKPIAEYVLKIPYCILTLRIFALGVLAKGLYGVFYGFHQGERHDLLLCGVSIVRPILMWFMADFFSTKMMEYGQKLKDLLKTDEMLFLYGGAGMAIGIVVADIVATVFLFLMFIIKKQRRLSKSEEGMVRTDSPVRAAQILVEQSFAEGIVSLMTMIPLIVGIVIYRLRESETTAFLESFGCYLLKYLPSCILFLFILIPMLNQGLAKISNLYGKDEKRGARAVFTVGLQGTVAWSLFFCIFGMAFSKHFALLFGTENIEHSSKMIADGGILVFLLCLSIYFTKCLLAFGKHIWLFIYLVGSNILFGVLSFLLSGREFVDATCLVSAGVIAALFFFIVAGFTVCRQMRFGMKQASRIIRIVISACVVGIVGVLLSKMLSGVEAALIVLPICFVILLVVYWGIILLLHNFRKQDYFNIPGGKMILYIGNLLHVFE